MAKIESQMGLCTQIERTPENSSEKCIKNVISSMIFVRDLL